MFTFKKTTFQTIIALILMAMLVQSCKNNKPSITKKIIINSSEMNDAVLVQLQDILNKNKILDATSELQLYNPHSIVAYYSQTDHTIFTNKMQFTNTGKMLLQLVQKDCKNFGLFSDAYHKKKIENIVATLSEDANSKQDAPKWATAEILMADAFFQIAKHIKNGRLYNDTNYKYFDSNLTINIFTPMLNNFAQNPNNIGVLFQQLEPNLHDYDSLKIYLQTVLLQINQGEKKYISITYPYQDSIKFVADLVQRIQLEGIATAVASPIDSLGLVAIIQQYQTAHSQAPTGKYSKEMIADMNINSTTKFMKIALALDKFKNYKIPNNGDYVIVNIPAYTLRGYTANKVAVESKVAVGKLATKTPVMESEISDIIVMPKWYVPPSILKIPGYIDRHRNKKNYTVIGKRVIQNSGPGNALGEMKFNFKSGEAVYLHDTNEKWAFNNSKRAVSHGCVRVQDYKKLASFISTISPIVEKNYKKVINTFSIDSSKNDTTFTYKYVVKDSIIYTTDVIPNMAKNKAHHELCVGKKVPIYIKYYTCAIRNGIFVMYDDVYGSDKILQEKYFSKYL